MVQVPQVLARDNFTIYCYFPDGRVKLYDAHSLIEAGGVFAQIADPVVFTESCIVMNNTLAWDLAGKRDPYACLDLDPDTVYEKSLGVPDPLSSPA
jgi:hypothetical protein